MTREVQPVTSDDAWDDARRTARRVGRIVPIVGIIFVVALTIPALYLTSITVSGNVRYLVDLAFFAALIFPLFVFVMRRTLLAENRSDAVVENINRQLAEAVALADSEAVRQEALARRQEFESRLANALDMAEGEPEVIDVIERSLVSTLPEYPVELLLADNSHAHLVRMAEASPTGKPPGCGVDSPDHCPAARRAQVQRFADSDDLDVCPKLRGRPDGVVSAICMPVSIMGRTVGVIHATGAARSTFADGTVADLATLAKLAGARIGLLRVMAETQLQAATDSLTGLLNRRSFEQRVGVVRRDNPLASFTMADLDHFKLLNDTYGHDTGDRALRLFAKVLSEAVRPEDIVCRYGGEEFVVAFPGCTPAGVGEILGALSIRLQAAITVSGLPTFTASFGVVQAGRNEDLAAVIARADLALFEAKHAGRDRIIAHDGPVGALSQVATNGAHPFSTDVSNGNATATSNASPVVAGEPGGGTSTPQGPPTSSGGAR